MPGTGTGTGTGTVIGCVYICPPDGGTGGRRAAVRSWVRVDRAAFDTVLHDTVLAWLERDWPFDSIE